MVLYMYILIFRLFKNVRRFLIGKLGSYICKKRFHYFEIIGNTIQGDEFTQTSEAYFVIGFENV